MRHTPAGLVAAGYLALQGLSGVARAENQMGYQLLSADEASHLPRGGGALGIDAGRAQRITDGGMTFALLRVNGVRRGSPGAQAGFNVGDQPIAVDGRVFANVAALASYVGAQAPGQQLSVDYIPAGGGPQQVLRTGVTVGKGTGANAAPNSASWQSTGLSTGSKVANGVGAVALFACYELGCFSRSQPQPSQSRQPTSQGLQPQR